MTRRVGNERSEDVLAARIGSLELWARGLTRSDIENLVRSANALKESPSAWPADERYWFSGSLGETFSTAQERALRRLWTRLMAAVTLGVTGRDLDTPATGSGVIGRIWALIGRPNFVRIEGEASTALERALGDDVWIGFTGIWNAACAALVPEDLSHDLCVSLEAACRVGLGQVPREIMIAERPATST